MGFPGNLRLASVGKSIILSINMTGNTFDEGSLVYRDDGMQGWVFLVVRDCLAGAGKSIILSINVTGIHRTGLLSYFSFCFRVLRVLRDFQDKEEEKLNDFLTNHRHSFLMCLYSVV